MALNGTMVKIETVTVGSGGTTSIDLQNIPQTYTDLVIYASLRQSGVVSNTAALLFNNSSANFSYRRLRGDGSAAASDTTGSALTTYSGQTASTFSNNYIYIPNYTSSNNKSFSIDAVNENNATSSEQWLIAGLWSQTAAISRITINPVSTYTFDQNSTVTLYGISKVPVGTKDYPAQILSDSPVGFWMLDETTGTTADDLTANNNNLTYQNSPTLNVSTGLTGITKAITLNGTNQRAVSATDLATFNINPSGNWSVEIWLRFSTTTFSTPFIIRNTDSQNTTQIGAININNSVTGRIQAQIADTGGNTIVLNSDGGWNDNNWHYVAVTAVSGGAFTLYVDGVSRASSTTARANNTASKGVYVGSNIGSQYYAGSLAAPAVYNTTLSPTQIIIHQAEGV